MSDILVIEPNDDDEYAKEAELDGVEEVEEEQSKNWLMGIAAGLIVSLVLIGETVGGLIGLNNYENLEFGSGITTLANCDSELTVKPIAKTEGSGDELDFKLDAFEISGISDECLNKTFTLSLYSSNFGTPANFATRLGDPNNRVNYLKFTLATIPKLNEFGEDEFGDDLNNPDWRIYPKVTESNVTQIASDGLPSPLTSTGLQACLGDPNTSPNINFSSADLRWAGRYSTILCPTDNYLVNIYGFVSFPGTDDGSLHSTTFSLSSTGNAQLTVGGRSVISDRSSHAIGTRTGNFLHRKGSTYSIDLWYYKGTGSGELKLFWNRDSSGNTTSATIVPSSALSFDKTVGIVIPSSEGVTNYQVIELSPTSNNRAIRVNFLSSRISTSLVNRFTIETSD